MAELAEQVDLDLDEALVTLWDAGFDQLQDPRDPVPPRLVTPVRRALGLASPRELGSVAYWQVAFGLDREALSEVLRELSINLSPRSRRLPPGAVKRLKRHARLRLGDVELPSVQEPEEPPKLPPLVWEVVGHERSLRYLTAEEVSGIHECLEQDFSNSDDPIQPPGIRDRNLLASAVQRPQTALGDALKYPTVEMAAAALLHSLTLNHPFHNGNKRSALVAMLVFLDENNMKLDCREEDLFRKVLQVAQHRLIPPGVDDRPDREVLNLAQWLKDSSSRVEQGERVLKWIRLKRILTGHGCTFDFFGGVGNRINIHRTCPEQRVFGRARVRSLSTQVFYAGDGTEVEKNTLAKIRRDLWLDDEHGNDSRSFYSMEIRPAQDFIVIYRKTLDRLARL